MFPQGAIACRAIFAIFVIFVILKNNIESILCPFRVASILKVVALSVHHYVFFFFRRVFFIEKFNFSPAEARAVNR